MQTASAQLAGMAERLDALVERVQGLPARPWFVPAVNVLALLLLTWLAARVTWLFLVPSLPQTLAEPVSTAASAARPFDAAPLLAAHLFGEAARPEVPESAVTVSNLNLVLVGVMASGLDSYALISVNGGPQEPYGIGQEVLNGARIAEVLPDRVILERGGAREILMLQGMEPSVMASIEVIPEPPRASPVAGSFERGPNRYEVPRNTVAEQIRNPQDFLRQALMLPNRDGGFLVKRVDTGSLHDKLGLRSGDIITGVNHLPVNNIQEAMSAYHKLAKVAEVRLEILRAGRAEVLQYTIR